MQVKTYLWVDRQAQSKCEIEFEAIFDAQERNDGDESEIEVDDNGDDEKDGDEADDDDNDDNFNDGMMVVII